MWPLTTVSEVWTSTPKVSTIFPYLLVQELPGILFNVALIQVCCQAHQANFRKAKVSKLDVPHGCYQEAGKSETRKYGVISWFSKSADFNRCQIFPLRLLQSSCDLSRVASAGRQAAVKEKVSLVL